MDPNHITTGQALAHLASVAIAIGAGRLMKRNPRINNKLIPAYNWLLAVIVQSAAAIAAGTAPASAATISLATFAWLPGLGDILLRAALDTLVATGTHSSLKNFKQGMKERLAREALEAAAKARKRTR